MKKVNTKKLATASHTLRRCSRGKSVFLSRVRQQVRAGAAYGEHSYARCCSARRMAWVRRLSASLIRNLLGLGSLMAFPGSMFGALLCGLVYEKTGNIAATLVGEVFGTAILGGLCAYPVAIYFYGAVAPRPSRFTHTSSRFSYQRQAARRYPQF